MRKHLQTHQTWGWYHNNYKAPHTKYETEITHSLH